MVTLRSEEPPNLLSNSWLLTEECYELLQIVWMKLMLRKSLAMLFIRTEKTPNYLIPWKDLPLMLLGEAFIMDVSYRE